MRKKAAGDDALHAIRDAFEGYDLFSPEPLVLEALDDFEQKTSRYDGEEYLAAILKWYKSLFLQRTRYLTRAEELLDEALCVLEPRTEEPAREWKLRVLVSLGAVHAAQRNYLDVEFYLREAEELALRDRTFSVYLGEIYSLLGKVSISLDRYSQARKYIALEKEKTYEQYLDENSGQGAASQYASALINFSRINRLLGVADALNGQYLDEAISVCAGIGDEHGILIGRLEQGEMQFVANQTEEALESASALEKKFRERRMYPEAVAAGLLAARVYGSMYEYDQSERKLNELIMLAKQQGLEQERAVADAFFELGELCALSHREAEALEYYRQSAKVGMLLGVRRVIIRSFTAAREIDKAKAEELLSGDLVYRDATFVRDRLASRANLFAGYKTKVRLSASTLYVEIAGFEHLMRRANDELSVKMMDELVDRLGLIIYQHQGYIDRFVGSGLIAVFEHGHTIRPEVAYHAVKCGVDIERALKHKSRKLKKVYGVGNGIAVRMGISSGEIYAMSLGNYIKREFTYMGSSVSLAARLERGGAERLMLIDQETYQLVRDGVVADEVSTTTPGLEGTAVYGILRLASTRKK
jgi:class 3 adenylate cyclase